MKTIFILLFTIVSFGANAQMDLMPKSYPMVKNDITLLFLLSPGQHITETDSGNVIYGVEFALQIRIEGDGSQMMVLSGSGCTLAVQNESNMTYSFKTGSWNGYRKVNVLYGSKSETFEFYIVGEER